MAVPSFTHLTLIKPDSINHTFHRAVKVGWVKHDQWWFSTELQGNFLTRASREAPESLANLQPTMYLRLWLKEDC